MPVLATPLARSVLLFAPVVSVPDDPVFVSDSFTGSDATVLSSHTPETGGAWVEHPSYSIDMVLINNQIRAEMTSGQSTVYYNDAAPDSADYRVSCDVVFLTDNNNGNGGPAIRVQSGSNDLYFARLNTNGNVIQLFKTVAGTTVQVGSSVAAAMATTKLTIEAIGDAIKVYADDLEIISATNAEITGAGFAGIRLAGTATSVTGVQVDDFEAENA